MSERRKFTTRGIVLKRVNYGEADRVMTFLTPDHGKIGAMAKGVRRERSKLAGGLELFSISKLGLIEGRGELDQLVSTRLEKHFSHIVEELERVELGYACIAAIERATEDDAGEEFFELLADSFAELDNPENELALIETWFYLNLLRVLGEQPNVKTDTDGHKLAEDKRYALDLEHGALTPRQRGPITSEHVKAWRLLLNKRPSQLKQVAGLGKAAEESREYIAKFYRYHHA